MATLKELGVLLTNPSTSKSLGVTKTPEATNQLAAINTQSKAFNGVGQFASQPQSNLYPEAVSINPAVFDGVRRIDKNRVIMGIAGSQLNAYSTSTVNMFNEVYAGGGKASKVTNPGGH